MIRGYTDAHTCSVNRWRVGTILRSIDTVDPIYLRITAIGEESVLVRFLDHLLGPVSKETPWSLKMNDWAEVVPHV